MSFSVVFLLCLVKKTLKLDFIMEIQIVLEKDLGECCRHGDLCWCHHAEIFLPLCYGQVVTIL